MPRNPNAQRASRAERVLRTYYAADADQFCALIDLLSDLRHYCDANKIGFAAQDHTAHGHYLSELPAPRITIREAEEEEEEEEPIRAATGNYYRKPSQSVTL